MINYAHRLPQDKNGSPMQDFPPARLSQTRYGSENASASSVISVTHNTTSLEIAAIGGPAVMRWVATSDTQASVVSAVATANFDHVIPSGLVRKFVIPIESAPQTAGSIQGVNREYGLYQRVAIKSIGVASVLLSEF